MNEDMQSISEWIDYEINRRFTSNENGEVKFNKFDKLDDEKINKLINNLNRISTLSPIPTVANATRGMRSVGESLIINLKTAYNQVTIPNQKQ
jgi:hypothetical protein